MNKLFLLPIVALFIVLAVNVISASTCCSYDYHASCTQDLTPVTCFNQSGTQEWLDEGNCYGGQCAVYTISNCLDSDGYNYYNKGNISTNYGNFSDACLNGNTLIEMVCLGNSGSALPHICSPEYCSNGECVPEFTTIGAGIAVLGAGIGFMLIRKKRK